MLIPTPGRGKFSPKPGRFMESPAWEVFATDQEASNITTEKTNRLTILFSSNAR
jgi:hypothetical protein